MLNRAFKLFGGAYIAQNMLSKKEDYLRTAKCCGIIGYIGQEANADEVLVQGIDLLQNRGYDSVGLATADNNHIFIDKQTNNYAQGSDCIAKIKKIAFEKHAKRNIGIAHTRWATCGDINDTNAHPHTDASNRIALVHNGTIYNHTALREELIQKGIKPASQTDTEVIALLIGCYLDEGQNLLASVESTLERLDGTWGLIIMSKDHPNTLIAARKGSPVVVGFGNNGIYISSEIIGFQKYTHKYFALEDREIIELSLDNGIEARVKERIRHADKVHVKMNPTPPFTTFFEEEIFEQPEAIKRALNFFHRLIPEIGATKLGGLEQNKAKALAIENMVLIGCGSSMNACIYAQQLFKHFGIFNTVTCVEASSFDTYDIPKNNPGIICLTQSGETADCLRSLQVAREAGVTCIGVTNVVGSSMTSLCDFGVFTNSGREIAVGASKSFTTQIVVLYLIVLWYSYYKNPESHKTERAVIIKLFTELPSVVEQTLLNNVEPAKKVAVALKDVDHMYVLGKGNGYPFAREIALKMKELNYIHAEALPAGELKHGPLALVVSDYKERGLQQSVVIVIALDDKLLKSMDVTISELKTRHAVVIVITDCKSKLDGSKIDYVLEIPKIRPFGPMLSLLPMQLVVKEVAALKGINIDKPRNLAKCVSVI